MKHLKLLYAAFFSMLLVAGSAGAQSLTERIKPVEVFGGLGVGNFTRGLGDVTGSGLAWNGRVGISPFRGGFLQNINAELAYQGLGGSASVISPSSGVISDESVNQHQLTIDGRVAVPIPVRDREIRPYGLIGLGYARIGTTNTLQSAGLDSDNTFAVPLGAGVSYDLSDVFTVDGRFTYNFLNAVDMPIVGDTAGSWSALVNLGARFGVERGRGR